MDKTVGNALNTQNQEAVKQQQPEPSPDLAMKGRFDRYNSSFLKLMIPLLTTRYVWLAIEDINPFNFLKKPDPALKEGFKAWQAPGIKGYVSRNFAALGMGATMLGFVSYYSNRTYQDIRTLYAESVGYELDKKPSEVTHDDIFKHSKNAALNVTRNAFMRRTFLRMAAAASFFLPWHIFRDFKHDKPKYDANANAGVGALGVYLSLEGLLRTPSFFDMEQNMVDTAIKHDDADSQQVISSRHIQTMLLLQRKHLTPNYRWPEYSSPEGQNEMRLMERIADLFNQTYHNKPQEDHANFTIGKFNYLVGFDLLGHYPASLGFVELANKSPDMKDVKEAATAIKNGQDAKSVFEKYSIDIETFVKPKQAAVTTPAQTRFSDTLQPKEKTLQARTHTDFATRGADPVSQHIS